MIPRSEGMTVPEDRALTLRDTDFLGQRNSGTVVILVNDNHCQCGRPSQSGTPSVGCCDDQPEDRRRRNRHLHRVKEISKNTG